MMGNTSMAIGNGRPRFRKKMGFAIAGKANVCPNQRRDSSACAPHLQAARRETQSL